MSPNAHTPPPAHVAVTERVNDFAVAPPAFLAVILYVVAVCTVIGVPDNNPVAVSNDVPAGFKGSIQLINSQGEFQGDVEIGKVSEPVASQTITPLSPIIITPLSTILTSAGNKSG